MEEESGPILIECDVHGERPSAVVCVHLLRATTPVGFIENESDPDDQQAWCKACEQMFVRERGMTDAFRTFNDMRLVCDGCYGTIKAKHMN